MRFTPDTILTLATLVAVGANTYLVLSLKNTILTMQLWVSENFISKKDLRLTHAHESK
jgi:hypothetical protein